MSLQELNYSTICIIEIIANANSYIFIKTYSNTYSVCKKDELRVTFFLFELQTFLTHIYEYLNYKLFWRTFTSIWTTNCFDAHLQVFKLHTVLTDIYEYLNYTLFNGHLRVFKLHTVLTHIYEYLNYTLFWRTFTSI